MATTEALAPSFDSAVLSVSEGAVRLIAARCSACDQYSFPRADQCPRCGAPTESATLPGTGQIYAAVRLEAPLTMHPVPTKIVQVDFLGVTVSGWLRSGTPKTGSTVAIVPLPVETGEIPVTAYCFESVEEQVGVDDA